MEQLSSEQQATIKKMSDSRLKEKLEGIGYEPADLNKMPRTELMQEWALAVAGKITSKPASVVETTGGAVGDAGALKGAEGGMSKEMEEFKMTIEEQRLQFEYERLEWEKKQRAAELKLQQDILELNMAKEKREKEKEKSVAYQVKYYGDAIRQMMPKFPTDPTDVPMYFECVEKLFDNFEVPGTIRGRVLMPGLNDHAKTLLFRLDQDKHHNYVAVRDFLLNEYKLTPSQFREKFERATKNEEETYTMFCSRVKSLLLYYCRSRKVGNSFDKLFSLLCADKIKSVLPKGCLDHILDIEKEEWLECEKLATSADVYTSHHTEEPTGHQQFENKVNFQPRSFSRPSNNSSGPKFSNFQNYKATQNRNNSSNNREQPAEVKVRKRCYHCNSDQHLAYKCDQRTGGSTKPLVAKTSCTVSAENETSSFSAVSGAGTESDARETDYDCDQFSEIVVECNEACHSQKEETETQLTTVHHKR